MILLSFFCTNTSSSVLRAGVADWEYLHLWNNARKGQHPHVLQLCEFNIWSMYVHCDPICSPWECEWFVFAGEPLPLMRGLGAHTDAGPNRIWLHTYGYEWTDGQFIAADHSWYCSIVNLAFRRHVDFLLFSCLYTTKIFPAKYIEDALRFTFA